MFCAVKLPRTHFWDIHENPVARLFRGRIAVDGATAFLHFSEGGMTQNLVHRMKYKGQSELCRLMGAMFGQQLQQRELFQDVDLIVPVPLHHTRERRRGYNQSAIIAAGLSEHLCAVHCKDAVVRTKATNTQTRKARYDRSANMHEVFSCPDPHLLRDKSVLIVDDVVTTGSTIEGVGQVLRAAGVRKLYVLAIAFPS